MSWNTPKIIGKARRGHRGEQVRLCTTGPVRWYLQWWLGNLVNKLSRPRPAAIFYGITESKSTFKCKIHFIVKVVQDYTNVMLNKLKYFETKNEENIHLKWVEVQSVQSCHQKNCSCLTSGSQTKSQKDSYYHGKVNSCLQSMWNYLSPFIWFHTEFTFS